MTAKSGNQNIVARKRGEKSIGLTAGQVKHLTQERGLKEETLRHFRVTGGVMAVPVSRNGSDEWVNIEVIAIPYFNGGRVWYYKCLGYVKSDAGTERVMRRCAINDGMFRAVKDVPTIPFNLQSLQFSKRGSRKNGKQPPLITEGEFDAMSCHQAGHHVVISLPDGAVNPGKNNDEDEDPFDNKKLAPVLSMVEDLRRDGDVIIGTDNDAPGLHTRKLLSRAIGLDVSSYLPFPINIKDSNDMIKPGSLGDAALRNLIISAPFCPIGGFISGHDVVYEKMKPALSCGISLIDEIYAPGVGTFNVITGRPGIGKTCMAMHLIHGYMKFSGAVPLIVSFENKSFSVRKYIAEAHLQKKWDCMTDSERESSVDWVNDRAFFFDRQQLRKTEGKDAEVRLKDIFTDAKAMMKRHGANILYIDPWNYFAHDVNMSNGGGESISRILTTIIDFIEDELDNEMTVFIVAHPVREGKDAKGKLIRPEAHNIYGGSHWETKPDSVLSIHRESRSSNITEFYTSKVKYDEYGKQDKSAFIRSDAQDFYPLIPQRTSKSDDKEWESHKNSAKYKSDPGEFNLQSPKSIAEKQDDEIPF